MKIKSLVLGMAVAAAVVGVAEERWWTQQDGDLGDPTKWDAGDVPGTNDHACIRGGMTTITTGDDLVFGEITFGRGYGRYTTNDFSGGKLTVNGKSIIGWFWDGHGYVRMTGGEWATKKLIVADVSDCRDGVLQMDGGTLTVSSDDQWTPAFVIGNSPGSFGLVNQTGGTLEASGIRVGNSEGGSGEYTISGGVLSSIRDELAIENQNRDWQIGCYGATGIVYQTGGVVSNAYTAAHVMIGRERGGKGYYNISGGKLSVANVLTLTPVSTGAVDTCYAEMNVSGDAQVEINRLGVGGWWGWNQGGTGVFNQTDGAVRIYNDLRISNNFSPANGTYNLTGGRLVVADAEGSTEHDNVFICPDTDKPDRVGRLNISGGEMVCDTIVSGDVWGNGTCSSNCLAEINLTGGSLTCVKIRNFLTVNMNGGVLRSTVSNDEFIRNQSVVNVQAGGAIIEVPEGQVVCIRCPVNGMPGDGGLIKRGAGELKIFGDMELFGPIAVEAGTLTIAGNAILRGKVTAMPGASFNAADRNRVTYVHETTVDYASAVVADKTISLFDGGATFDDYRVATLSIQGAVKIENAVAASLKSAVLHFDPSVESSMTIGAETTFTFPDEVDQTAYPPITYTPVSAIRNLGTAGCLFDQMIRDYNSRNRLYPHLVRNSAMNGQTALRFEAFLNVVTGTAGQENFQTCGFFAPAACLATGNNQPRAFFAVTRAISGEIHSLSIAQNDATHYWGFGSFGAWMHAGDVTTSSWDPGMGRDKFNGVDLWGEKTVVSCERFDSEVLSGTIFREGEASERMYSCAYEGDTGAATNVVTFGSRWLFGGQNGNTWLGEAMMFDREVSDNEAVAINTYLKNKWIGGTAQIAVPDTKVGTLTLGEDAVLDLDGAVVEVENFIGSGTIVNCKQLIYKGKAVGFRSPIRVRNGQPLGRPFVIIMR